jgi:uncharacterized membrane protein YsdA (DUF1294 family)
LSAFYFITYAFTINLIAYGLFGFDKQAAEQGRSRVPEKTLLLISAIGGSFGAVFAQKKFRHKTKKQPFKTYLILIIGAQIAVVSILLYQWIWTA